MSYLYNILIFRLNTLNLGMNFQKRPILILICILFILFGYTKSSISQTDKNGKIVAFHPSVGNSINLQEKKEFGIFTEYNDSLFESAQLVKYNSESYTVLLKTTNGQSFEKPISIQELDALYANIEKVKPVITDDYVEVNKPKEKQFKKDNRSESAQIVAEITIQIVFVLLEILAHTY